MIKKINKYDVKKINIDKIRLISILFIMFILCIPSTSILVKAADTIIVDDDGLADYSNIQDAINNANVGDYIIVKDGTYGDQLTVNVNGLTISAASGETPTIYVPSYSPGIDVSGYDVLIEGFEIYGNGSLTGGPFPTIRASTGSDGLSITGNDFKVFTGEQGQMALSLTSGVSNVQFYGNTLTNYDNEVYNAAYFYPSLPKTYYGSIQDVINIADPGDTIQVTSGLFNERLVIDKQITLNGNNEETIVQPTNIPTAGVYDVEIDANGTIIDGFTFDFNDVSDARSGNGIVVSDLNDPPVVDVRITNCIIYTGHTNTGIQTGKYSDVSGLVIDNNLFYADYDGLGEGIYVNPFTGLEKVLINNNEFYGNIYSGVSIESSNVTVSNNVIDSNYTKGIYGIRFIELTGGQNFTDVNFTNNDIQNVTNGIRIGTTTDVGSMLISNIKYNTIINNDVGVWVRYGANLSDSVTHNSIYNNTVYAIQNNDGTTTVNATKNYWGHISGPYHPINNSLGLGDNITDNIIFTPWNEFDGYSVPPEVTYEVGVPNELDGEIITDYTPIRIFASDNDSGLDSITYRIWNSTHRWGNWIDYTGQFTLPGEGKHYVEYNVTDNTGTSNRQINLHYVDTTNPNVEVLYPNGGEYISGTLEIQWNAADKILDQEQIIWNNSYTLTEDYPGHIQSFKPTEDRINSVQLLLYGDHANITVRLFSEITPVPISIGQSSRELESIGGPTLPVWIDFPLNSEVFLDPEETYYIGVSQDIIGSSGFYWYLFNSSGGLDPYQYGESWLKSTDSLDLHTDWDWVFRTMYWNENIDITVEYSLTGVSPWSTIADDETNDGSYQWDTTSFPDRNSYRIRLIVEDIMSNMGSDISNNIFTIDNVGPSITDITITDTTIGNTEYTKDGDTVEVIATITGNPVSILADLTELGGGIDIEPDSYTGSIAKWTLNSIA
ncbi:nitrous oxide reductase family maturation protein NosD, partial [Thermoplasmatota archaeon]